MVKTLKELRKIAQKKSMGMRLTALDMKFLNSLDLIFLDINNRLKDRPISVQVTNRLRVKLKNPKLVVFGNRKAKVSERSWGGRFKYQEI